MLAFSVSPAVAGADSVKISLPRHIKVGKPASIKLTGFASRKGAQIALLSDKRKCRATFNAEGNLSDVGIWVDGPFVHGHFKYIKKVPFATSTHGRQYFCAYLTYSPGITGTITTTARASLRFRIPF